MPDLIEKLRLAIGRGPDADGEPDWVIVDLQGAYPTYPPQAPLQAVLQRGGTLEGLTERLDRIGKATWVKGVLVRVSALTADLATADAIGRALGRLAERKRVVAYLPDVSMTTLLVTTRLRDVVAPESAIVSLPGFAAEPIFLGAFLRRRGIDVENLRIGEYKSALAPYSEERMDEHDRAQLTAYLDVAERTWLSELAAARGADAERARGWIDGELTSAAQLLEAGLITRIAYDDEIAEPVDQHLGRAVELLGLKRTRRRADGVAVVPVVGAIVTGRGRSTPPLPFLPGPMAGSDTVVANIRRADRDEHTKAILLYVSSGGGSALASDLICRAVARARKPVVAVMGDVAASGGYYVLAPARHVVASPYTLTGSIGVVVGKAVLAELYARHGLRPEAVGRERALWASSSRPFTDAERAWAERLMRETYDRFVERVATGRRLSRERVDEIGRGRIWSGADAKELGLVDELGDLDAGLAAARRLGGLPADAPARLVSAGFQVPGLPTFARGVGDGRLATAGRLAAGPAGLLDALWPFGEEKVLAWMDRAVRVR